MSKNSLILAIETSCDDTSVALVENGTTVIAEVRNSQIEIHNKTGGVVPEVASREHVLHIMPCIEELIKQTNVSPKNIESIATTTHPGLIGSLLVGTETAKALCFAWKKPFLSINHIHGHIYSIFLGRSEREIELPAIVLTVSGGHNDIYILHDHYNFEKIGETLDDAAGEAFDKVARMLNLGYPGGPVISEMAEKGNPHRYNFPRPLLKEGLNFSFSGLKTAVKYTLQDIPDITPQIICDICASFQLAIVDTLTTKALRAAKKHAIKNIWLAGGVSANTQLKETLSKECTKLHYNFFTPIKNTYSTDNACMIAAAAYFKYKTFEQYDDIFEIEARSS